VDPQNTECITLGIQSQVLQLTANNNTLAHELSAITDTPSSATIPTTLAANTRNF
jgi:hypothetical protein